MSRYVHAYPPVDIVKHPCLSYSLNFLTWKSLSFKNFLNPIPKWTIFILLPILIFHLIVSPIISLIGVDIKAICQKAICLTHLTTLPTTAKSFETSCLLHDMVSYFLKPKTLLVLYTKDLNYSALNLFIICWISFVIVSTFSLFSYLLHALTTYDNSFPERWVYSFKQSTWLSWNNSFAFSFLIPLMIESRTSEMWSIRSSKRALTLF